MLRGFVLRFMLAFLAALRVFVRSRGDTALEVLALRQQLAVLKRKQPRPALRLWDRLFWTSLRRMWPRWVDALIIVKPETVVGWHRAGFRRYWRWRSRPRGGRPKVAAETQALIRRLAAGLYVWLPLGLRTLRKVERIVREEMDRAGALELCGELFAHAGVLRALTGE